MHDRFSITHARHLTAAARLPPCDGQRFGVFGLGVTGRAVAQLLAAHGAQLVLADADPAAQGLLGGLFPGAVWHVGALLPATFADCAAVFVSQGVPPDHALLRATHELGVALFGEVELVARFAPDARLVAVTGTNGKSTTTALLGDMVRAHIPSAFVGGNLGVPIASWLLQGAKNGVGVLELSSSLIDGIVSVAPEVAVVLNVTPDHLERYGTLSAYAKSKARLVQLVPPHGTAVLNADDPAVAAMAPLCQGRVWWFGQRGTLPGDGLLLTPQDTLQGVGRLAGVWPAAPMAHARLLGRHNRENALAALLAAQALLAPTKAPSDATFAAYQRFAGLPHRLQLVGTLAGARWLNDSKATNDASAATAIAAVDGPCVLLLGGHDKGGGYDRVVAALRGKPAKAVLAFGAARRVIAQALDSAGVACEMHETLGGACQRALALVAVGDAVLLSPACSSFDAFRNYVHRGEWFAGWVQAQADRGDPSA